MKSILGALTCEQGAPSAGQTGKGAAPFEDLHGFPMLKP